MTPVESFGKIFFKKEEKGNNTAQHTLQIQHPPPS
jgi:hypothetical protein